jgi:2'-phosphotransferase
MAGNVHDEEAAHIDAINDLSLRAKGQRDGRGKERGGKLGGGGGRQSREVMISKALSKLLRHDAEKEGVVLDREGFARLDQVVSLNSSLGARMSIFEVFCYI